MSDTIFAPSSGAGRAGVTVMRISGPHAALALERLTGRPLPEPRRATLAALYDPESGELLDRGLVLWFPGPASFTGEDLAEFQVHGSRAVVDAMLQTLARLPGCAPAEPGAFTRRAFDAGKLDLTEVEGLADLIAAETAVQRRQALRQLDGGLSERIADWQARLARHLAYLEAAIDFPDEELPSNVESEALSNIFGLRAEMAQHIAVAPLGERLREGLEIAIVGPPNAGKSSLLNALAQRDVAIVAETAGTTRDVIEVRLDLGGYPVTLADTAGLRAAGDAALDPVEMEGIRRSRARAEAADLKLMIFDATDVPDPAVLTLADADTLLCWNKIDLLQDLPPTLPRLPTLATLALSTKNGAGLSELVSRLTETVEVRFAVAGAAPLLTRARHRRAVEDAVLALDRAAEAELPELTAEDLRLALRALGRVAGQVDVEDLLDVIFREFCIGK